MALSLAHTALGPASDVSERAPLVVLHGMLGSSANWRTLGRKLADDRAVYLLDARNHGRSPHADSMTYAEQAADLAQFLDAERLENAYILGHSMGGKAAMHFALSHPDKLAGLIVVDIAPVAYPSGDNDHLALVEAMMALSPDELASRQAADEALARTVGDAPLRAFLLHNLERRDGNLCWRPNLSAIRANFPALRTFDAPAGARVEAPTEFLVGALSNYVTPEHESEIQRLFPGATTTRVAGAGHWVHAERPNEVLATISAFLKEN